MDVPAKYEGFSKDPKQHLDTPEEQVEAERKAPGCAGCQGGRTKYAPTFDRQNPNDSCYPREL